MPFDWFSSKSGGSAAGTSVPDLIARKKYGPAAELLRSQLDDKKDDTQLRLQLGDVLILDGKVKEATTLLSALADDLARQGFAAKSIAVLKKIQKIDPTRGNVEEKLASLIKEKAAAPRSNLSGVPMHTIMKSEDMEYASRGAGASTPAPSAKAHAYSSNEEPAEIDMSGFTFGLTDTSATESAGGSFDTRPTEDVNSQSQATVESSSLSTPPLTDPSKGRIVDSQASLLQSPAQPAELEPTGERVTSPLFDSFAQDELLAVMRGLELLTFEPGDIVVTEGQPGLSLFVITTGMVKAFVRNKDGGNTQVRELNEGDFFGEISLLTGKPRTATVTAATPCEMLELQKATLDSITKSHPRVREVVQSFYDERTQNAAEARIRGIELRNSKIARESGLADVAAADSDPAEETTIQISEADAAMEAAFDDIVIEDSETATPAHASASSASELSASERAEAAKRIYAFAVARTKERNWPDAVLAWTRYAALKPTDTEAINVLGIVCGKAGRWKEAAQAFEQSAQVNPKDPSVFYNLGFAYSQLGLWNPAVQSYHEALALKPDYERAQQNLKVVLERVSASSG